MQHAYFVSLETKRPFAVDTYADISDQLANALQTILGDLETLRLITHTPTLTDAHVEVEISHEPATTVIARVVVRGTAPKMSFDKTKFTIRVKDLLPFAVKISKQAIPQEDLEMSYQNAR